MRELLVGQLIYKEKENEGADLIRGGIKVIDSFMDIPNLIQKRMEFEKSYQARIKEMGSEG